MSVLYFLSFQIAGKPGTINDKCKQNNDIKITREDILRKVSGKTFRNCLQPYGIESAPGPSDVADGAFYRVVQPCKYVTDASVRS